MKALTRKANEKQEKRINMKMPRLREFTEAAVFFALSFALSSSTAFRYASPFAVSLISVSKRRNFIYSAVGGALGYLIFCPGSFARYGAAVVIVTLGAFAIAVSDLKSAPAMPMMISFLSLAVTGSVVNLRSSAGFSEYALTLAEAVLGAGGAFFMFRAISIDFRRLRFKAVAISDLTCLIISASLVIMSLSRITVFGVSPVRILCVLIILTAARFASDRLGIILALSLGFALGIAGENTIFLVGAYAFSALLGLLFSPFGRLGISASFTLAMALFSIASSNENAGVFTLEALFACALFAFLPRRLTDKIESFFHGNQDASPDGSLRQSLVIRLRLASNAMTQISESVSEVSEKISEINEKSNAALREKMTEDDYITQEIIDGKTNEIRLVAAQQFFSIADMLCDLAAEFDEAEHFDNASAGKIRRMLGEYEIYPNNISVIEDKLSRVRIEIVTAEREPLLSDVKIQNEISKICNRYFGKGRVTGFKSSAMISFSEKPNFSLDVGFAQHSAEGKLCGDTVKIINDGRGRSVLIISDGMGRGGRAALDGAMGAGLLSKLLSAGFGFDSALKVVNSALLVKSNEESLATLDCACIDLFTGRTDLYKAGAAASFIIKGERVTKCELSSMPAGILRQVEFAKRTAVLSDEDVIVLMSDGVTEVAGEWLSVMLSDTEGMSSQDIADCILQETLRCAKPGREDDMSVIAARVKHI